MDSPAHGVLFVCRAAGVGQGERLPVGCADVCATLLRVGAWRCCGGRGSMGARLTTGRASGAAGGGHLAVLQGAREHHCPETTALGLGDVLLLQLMAGTGWCCSGHGGATALGMNRRVRTPLATGILRCCGGQ